MKYHSNRPFTAILALVLVACGQATAVPEPTPAPAQVAVTSATLVPATTNTARAGCERAVQAQFLDPKTVTFLTAPMVQESRLSDGGVRIIAPFDAAEVGMVHHKSYTCTVKQAQDQSWIADNIKFGNR